MTRQITPRLSKLKIIFNDDLAISDFIADLQDKSIRREFQKFIRDAEGKPAMLLCGCMPDNIQLLILVGDPFGFNEGDNKLVLYADNDINGLCLYFTNQMEHTSDDHEYYPIINEIRLYLPNKWDEKLRDDDYVRTGRAT